MRCAFVVPGHSTSRHLDPLLDRMDLSGHSSKSRNNEHEARPPEANLDVTTTNNDNPHPQDPLVRISSGKDPARHAVLSQSQLWPSSKKRIVLACCASFYFLFAFLTTVTGM